MDKTNRKLKLSKEEMRSLGYKVIDMLVDHAEEVADKPVSHGKTPEELREIFAEPIPHKPSDPKKILKRVKKDIISNLCYST